MITENEELQMARNYALYTHRNIFLTGKAGTGKTTFLRRLREESHKRMIVVAPTGVAAINAGGMTIHSFFQMAPGLYLPGGLMVAGQDARHRFSFSKQKINILQSLDLLVIDEISMVRADLLDAIDDILRRFQQRDKPFGGVQLLLIGDLQQLAPVATDEEWRLLQDFYTTPYFFSSTALQKTDFVCIELRKVYRQQDLSFVQLLNDVRDGQLTAATYQLLHSRYLPAFVPPAGEDWITLTTHNAQAAQLNSRRLAELSTPPVTFQATIKGEFPELSYPTDVQLTLKVGAQVMFCKNDPSNVKAFYNGRIGRVEDITEEKVTVRCGNDRIQVGPLEWTNSHYATDPSTGVIREEVVGTFTQIPLRTAWAITIHKSQGLTFDRAIINAGRAFSHGQVYVALSRCRTLDGLVLSTPISPALVTTDPDVQQFNAFTREHQPTMDTFIRDRRSYVEDILCSVFDFSRISMLLRHYVRLTSEFTPFFPAYIHLVQNAATETDARLMAVGVKFQAQIRQLIPLTESFRENLTLRERVKAAMSYYCKETASLLQELIDTEIPEIDNARGKELIEKQFQDIKTAYEEKMNIFIACLGDFSLNAYWDAKAKAAMTEEVKVKKPRAPRKRATNVAKDAEGTTPATSKSTAASGLQGEAATRIYRALLAWRKTLAAERKLPTHFILSIKAILGIANTQPATPDELLEIAGVGAKTVNDYGPELLELVARNR
ncbi:MAG: AAA family ATPase [Bacteroidaceae bacterium]|nr:AAA family ATPase [Bacteroidaceae bacterium]